jgi:geranylgeranyl reductase family protein
MNPQSYEILILGGGPAGLSAAIAAAEAGCGSVAVVERRIRWGWPIQCAEMVPKLIGEVVSLERDSIVQAVSDLQFHFGGRPIGTLSAPAYILDRSRFEAALADRTAHLGVALWQPASVRAIAGDGALVAQGGNQYDLEARVIIGADGPQSLVRRVLTDEPMEFAFAMQHVLPLAKPSEVADIFLALEYGAGYGWCFPRGREANVGVALPSEHRDRLRAALDDLIGQLVRSGRIVAAPPIRRTGGLVPAGGPVAQTVVGSIMLAGDAAGQVHPLSGAGILTACACGRMAGEAAARAAAQKSLSLLDEYETRWRDLYDGYFARGLESRRRLRNCDPDGFLETVQAAWRFRQID